MNSLQETDIGLVGELSIGGTPCNAFGIDFANLSLEVTYDSEDRYVFLKTSFLFLNVHFLGFESGFLTVKTNNTQYQNLLLLGQLHPVHR